MSGAVIGSSIINISKGGNNMGGVVAGSTMRDIAIAQERWGAVSINTGCNLECPRCYLGKKNGNITMSLETAKVLAEYAKENWEGIVIIGTEPLLDEMSVKIVDIFASQIKTYLLTNGVNLLQFVDKLKNVRRIDISLDGGSKTYCRSPDFQKILAGAQKWKKLSGGELYVLHVLNQENCKDDNIKDMLEAGKIFGAEKTIFSPYIRTIGGSELATISIREIFKALDNFSGGEWMLIIDPYHALIEGREWKKIKEDISHLSEKNIFIVDFDPGEKIDRIDVNGYAHHPYIALHPGVKLLGRKII